MARNELQHARTRLARLCADAADAAGGERGIALRLVACRGCAEGATPAEVTALRGVLEILCEGAERGSGARVLLERARFGATCVWSGLRMRRAWMLGEGAGHLLVEAEAWFRRVPDAERVA